MNAMPGRGFVILHKKEESAPCNFVQIDEEIFSTFFVKPIDKSGKVWYNMYVRKREREKRGN